MRDTIFFAGVVARRDLLTALRSWQSLSMLVAITLLLAMGYVSAIVYGRANYTAAVDALSFFYRAQTWLLYAAALTAVPCVAAVSMTSERSSDRYDMLLTTPIPPTAIVLGKYFSVLMYILLFYSALCPFTGILYFFGMVESRYLVEAAVWFLLTACCTASIGIAVSAAEATPWQACARAYPFMIFLVVARTFREDLQSILGVFIPPASFHAICLTLATVVAIGQAIIALHRLEEPSGTPKGKTLPRTPREALRALFPPGTTHFPDSANPFGRRSLCGSSFQNRGLLFFLALLTSLFYTCVVAPALSDPAFAALPWVIERSMLLFVPAMVALQFVKELGVQTMDANRLTLCRPLELVLGQYVGLARRLLPFLLPVLAVRLVFTSYLSMSGSGATLHWLELILLPLHLAVVVALALAGSSFARTTLAAILLAFGPVLVLGLPFLILTIAESQSGSTWTEQLLAFIASSLLPGIAIVGGATALAWFRVWKVWNRRA